MVEDGPINSNAGELMAEQHPTGEVLKNIPPPKYTGGRGRNIKFKIIEVGECIFFETQKEAATFITSQRYQFGKLGIHSIRGMYVRETANGQTGVWRVK